MANSDATIAKVNVPVEVLKWMRIAAVCGYSVNILEAGITVTTRDGIVVFEWKRS